MCGWMVFFKLGSLHLPSITMVSDIFPTQKKTQSISLHHDFTFPNSKSKDTAPGSGAKLFVSFSTRQQKEKETGTKVDVLHYYIYIY